MKKLILAIIFLIVIIGGVIFGLTYKSNKNNPTNTNNSAKSNQNAPAVNNSIVITKTSSSLGQYLAEPNGTPLYTYGGDSSGKSNCTGSCLASWPAYQDKGSTTDLPSGFSTIKRTDNGENQYTYEGLPLYTFASDNNDQPAGNGVMDFSLAKPASASASSSNSSSSNNYNY